MHDKELASAGVWMHGSCHGKNTGSVCKVVCNAVLSEFAFNAVSRTAHAGSVRAAALDHEAVDDTVEDQTVIKSFFTRLIKLFTVLGATSG